MRIFAHPIRWLLISCLACLMAACAGPSTPSPTAALVPTQTATQPTVLPPTVTPFPSRTPLPSITPTTRAAQPQPVAAVASPTPAPTRILPPVTAAPSSTSALLALTPVQATAIPDQSQPKPGSPPPLDITLPPGWKSDYRIMPIRDVGVQSAMNMAVYLGPVQGGKATIIVLWGFPSIVAPPTRAVGTQATGAPGMTMTDLLTQALWGDGLRLLQGTVIDITCNFGNFGQRDFTIGGLHAVGEIFAASRCEADPDTAGWFAGVNQSGSNFLFYMYFDPPEAYNSGRAEVQKILDTVNFHALGPTPAVPPPTNTRAIPTTTPAVR